MIIHAPITVAELDWEFMSTGDKIHVAGYGACRLMVGKEAVAPSRTDASVDCLECRRIVAAQSLENLRRLA